jgi:hypothetical protein
MFPPIADLRTESDVEQKLVWPLLTSAHPEGFGYASVDVLTKLSTRRLEIGKGQSRKLYYPDYIVILAGLPVMVVEAKNVGESIDVALDEARLYANEINAQFPYGINPCIRAIACNGEEIQTSPHDTAIPDLRVSHSELNSANTRFSELIKTCAKSALYSHAQTMRRKLRPKQYERPVALIGGRTFQAEELPQNAFGATIAGDYGHIFNPKTREDRALIAREAYISSTRQQRYIEPIDRLIRNAVAPAANAIPPMANTGKPQEILAAFRDRKKLENQILLLVGSVGAGKSTFVDYLANVALPQDIRDKTVWLRIDLNDAPLEKELAYKWIAESIVNEFKSLYPDMDFDGLEMLEKLFGRELATLKRGALKLLNPKSEEYLIRVSDRLSSLQLDGLAMAKAIAQIVCSGPNRLMVLVLDNCDKRTRDEQLLMFQIAGWIQSEFKCLVVLPLRDVTFDLYRNSPPLDTAIKQFVFRIEPPSFSDVLQERVRLALSEIGRDKGGSNLSFQLPNGMRVTYPAEDQALYLASIMRSLYAHDRFVRQVMTGLAGRDVRKALELFLDFCMSGHIGEDEIYKIRFFEGNYALPLSVVARVLLRMHRRFYDGERAYLKNMVQCDPSDALPDHFVRLTILHWLERKLRVRGPAGVEGFHPTGDLITDLASLGHDAVRVREELVFLATEGCIVAEHLRSDDINDRDLLKITASGVIHLQLMANPEYLAACAEDTWISDVELCKRVAARLSEGKEEHFSPLTTARNAKDLVAYLRARSHELIDGHSIYLDPQRSVALDSLREIVAKIEPAEVDLPTELFIGAIPYEAQDADLKALFESKGIPVRSLKILRDPAGRSKGVGFLEPATRDGVLAALDLHKTVSMNGRLLRIEDAHRELDAPRRPAVARPPLNKRIYIGNLPYAYSDIEIRALIASADLTAVDIYIMRDGRTGKSKGAAFVELRTLDDAAKAIGALDGRSVDGRRLEAHPAKPKSTRE